MEGSGETMDGNRQTRPLLKPTVIPLGRRRLWSNHFVRTRAQFRQNCLKRVQEDRAILLWKLRLSGRQALDQKETVESVFRGIVANELKKIKHSSLNDQTGISESGCDDLLWEYDSHRVDYSSAESNYEELLIEMERCLYEDIREELIRKELEVYEEEDEYLAQAVCEHLQLNDGQAEKKESIWCPICKRGEVRENHHIIYCTSCDFQLDLGNDKLLRNGEVQASVGTEYNHSRLGEAHEEHLDKGC